MKAQIKGIERTESGVFINVLPPNQVTDSKHAQLIKGLKTITGKYKKIPHDQNPFILAREFMDILTANDSEGTRSYIHRKISQSSPRVILSALVIEIG